ncbi:pentapeptide repeat-containing protein [Nodosilinea sp. LEGE 07088]|uniref:pentapeptide repeat-containing protein n=1 Tax=Nodosilinea sp. LEGE 07088 TaxID=2777968 RepID=UPI001882833E|nr:pentapeptide repeat-containing protein [Nodosilinea sp. LEGE 07088]MBE9137498.1 pentapeptide repeat-containing protein [Nodosilinea sp. LEGE 07088]
MAQTSRSQPISAQVSTARVLGRLSATQSLALRRLVAWGLEVGLLVSSVALPWGLGEWVRRQADPAGSVIAPTTVELNPVVATVQTAIARPLGISRQRLVTAVPRLTNLLWFTALVLPVALTGSQIYGLATRGKTWPKAWLGLQVVAINRSGVGAYATLVRELGRWGVPTGAAYGVWLAIGAFPSLPWLGGLALVCSLGAGATGRTNPSRRAWYDYLAGTRVVVLRGGQVPSRYTPDPEDGEGQRFDQGWGPLLSSSPLVGLTTEEYGGLTAIVLSPDASAEVLGPRGWRRHLPVIAALAGVVALGGLGALWLDRRLPAAREDNALFLALVENLSRNATSFSDRQAAALALASSQDPRAIPLLVDMLAQTGDPDLLNTLQQALVTLGPGAIPPLQRLNLALANDLLTLPAEQRLVPQLRQRTVKRTLTKILVLHSGNLNQVDLSGTNLAYVLEGPDNFTLLLEQQNLAGIIWRNAVLSGARLRKAKFYNPGDDGLADTFDDWVSDFSGSDLTEASFVAAHLRHVGFRNTSLLRANLSNALAPYSDFSGANASSAWFIEADVSHAIFNGTSLVGADFTDADLTAASLVAARLRQAHLAGATLTTANLTQADLADANLSGANLTGANLSQTLLTNSWLTGANLSQANLEQADLSGSDLAGVVFTGANLTGVNLANARFFTPEQSQGDSFVAIITEPDAGHTLAGVDFSETLNLGGDQLEFVCRQGGLHPACGGGF